MVNNKQPKLEVRKQTLNSQKIAKIAIRKG